MAKLLSEQQVQRSYSKIVSKTELTEADFQSAEELLEELRMESPLRHRLSTELEELRKIKGVVEAT